MSATRVYSGYRESAGSWISRIVTFIFGLIELLILIRFILLLFGANTQSGFVQWIHQASGFFMAPFIAIFGNQTISGATFEWAAIVAIAVYALIAWLIVALIGAVTPVRSAETVETVETVRTAPVETVGTAPVGTTQVVQRKRFNWGRRP